jgi:3-methylcrotonyl-CoA carboxylase alpha subunit
MSAERAIRKILIANRGEIALRVLRAVRRLGIGAVAVYAEEERSAAWLAHFQESVSLGTGPVTDTYLNIAKIVEAALDSGAGAIHPGYGFLSENPALARACEAAGLIFIGPPAPVLEKLGDKLASRELARQSDIPVLPAYSGLPENLLQQRAAFEYPLMVKAAAGGGGKGMRLVHTAGELEAALETTAREAGQYFGDDRIYLEKYLDAPRHVEVQVMADAHGDVVHLFERECSIQRRHQKVIEEAPVSGIPDAMLCNLREAALKLARAVKYVNAGTFEFLVGNKGDYYFLEANPRIQVEHGVTELVTGRDLVMEQIRVAEGLPLSFSQSDLQCNGHAIEARIYAEDPWQDHLPSPGRIRYFHVPTVPGSRTETGCASGSVVDGSYDPMIAKVMFHASSRPEAAKGLYRLLGASVIAGITHNIPLIREVLVHPGFMDHHPGTGFLSLHNDTLYAAWNRRSDQFPQDVLTAAGCLLYLFAAGDAGSDPYRHNVPWIRLQIGGMEREGFCRLQGRSAIQLWLNDSPLAITEITVAPETVSFVMHRQNHFFHVVSGDQGSYELHAKGLIFRVAIPDLDAAVASAQKDQESEAGHGFIRAPLPGKVSRIFARPNDFVEKGDSLLTIESMKLENAILASMSGVVAQVFPSEGSQVSLHDPLVILRAVESLTT